VREVGVGAKQRIDTMSRRKKMRIREVARYACAIQIATTHGRGAILHQNSPRILHKSLNITAQTNYDSP
jgi:hypothetical protein